MLDGMPLLGSKFRLHLSEVALGCMSRDSTYMGALQGLKVCSHCKGLCISRTELLNQFCRDFEHRE